MRILFLCAATFAAGLLAGSLIWPDTVVPRHRAPPAAQSPRVARTVEDRATFSSPTDERLAGKNGDRETIRNADVRQLANEAAAEIDRIVTSERAESILDGEGTITGTVRDPAGEPIEGVIVTALPEAQPFGLAVAARQARERPHVDRSLADVARDAIEGELWRRYARLTTKSGPDGHFDLKGLMDARHTLTAFHDSYDVKPLSHQGKVVPDAVVDFLARPVAEVRVEVLMPDGTVAEHAWLKWQGPHGTGWGPWTREAGTVRLPIGSCKVQANTTVPEPLQSEEVERVIGPRTSEELLTLQLTGRRILTARLVLPGGFVVPKTVEYRLRPMADAREEVDPESLLQDQSQRHAQSRSPGRAFWYDLEPGHYLVAAFLDKRRLLAHAIAEVGAEASEVELPVSEPELGTFVTVRLLGPDGGPVPGQASFRVITGPENRPRAQRADALQRDDGAWLVFLDRIDPQGGSDATLRVGTRDYGSALHPCNLRGGGTITLRFGKPARLKLQLDRYSGSGVEGALYVALRGEVGADAWRLVSPNGSCDLSGVQPGAYRLLLVVRKKNRNWPIYQRRINLDSGEEELSLLVPTLHTLRVRWAGKGRVRSATLRSNDEGIGPFRREARLAGRIATFDLLGAGSYQIQCGARRAAVRVPG
ncbi:MAG: carboxypeptidase-like regulatory domain-containing protein, partial [Planctomycetota bacterium]